MVVQGQIIKINLDPKKGHEQKGYRPYLCLSHQLVEKYSNVAVFAPISNTDRDYPFYKPMPDNSITIGKVLLDQLVTIDYKSRGFNNVETLDDIFMDEALSIVKTIFQKN